jgi:hypothetical protein
MSSAIAIRIFGPDLAGPSAPSLPHLASITGERRSIVFIYLLFMILNVLITA